MGSATPNSALRFPAVGDAPNVPSDMQNLAADLDMKVWPHFASTSLRDSTITAPSSGQACTVGGIGYIYDTSLGWQRVLTQTGWLPLSLATNFTGFRVAPACRVFNGNLEFRGMCRYSVYLPTAGVLYTNGTAVGNTTSAAYFIGLAASFIGADDYRMILGGMDNAFNPSPATLALNPRADGGIRTYCSAANSILYFTLDGLRLPTA